MKVDTAFKLPSTQPPRANGKAVTGSQGDGEAAQVKLSASSQVQGGESVPVNSSRIQDIKQAIAEGRFKINPEAIAERLISTAQELISSQRKA